MMAASEIRRVLVVDDDELLLSGLARALSRQFHVLATSEPETARVLAWRWRPEVGIVDLCLGVQRGVDLLRELRREHPAMKLALMSAFAADGMSLPGADVVIAKPVSATDIIERLETVDRDRRSLATIERDHILDTLDSCGGNVSRAATLLGIRRSTLQRKLRQLRPSPVSTTAR